MKRNLTFLTFSVFCIFNIHSQVIDIENASINELRLYHQSIKDEIKLKQDTLNILHTKIKEKEEEELMSKFLNKKDEFIITTTLLRDGKLREENSPISKTITQLRKNDSVKLTDYKNGYWLVNKGRYFGYISEMFLNETNELEIFKRRLIIENKRLDSIADMQRKIAFDLEYEKKVSEEKEERLAYEEKIIKEFGENIGRKLINEYYWLGMTERMAIVSLGNPSRINKSFGTWGSS